jgi:hypothetical protein
MKVRITKHLTSVRKFDLVVKEIVCMLASGSSNRSSRGVARILGVDKCNIWKALGRQIHLDTMNLCFLDYKEASLTFKCSTSILEGFGNTILDKLDHNFTQS